MEPAGGQACGGAQAGRAGVLVAHVALAGMLDLLLLGGVAQSQHTAGQEELLWVWGGGCVCGGGVCGHLLVVVRGRRAAALLLLRALLLPGCLGVGLLLVAGRGAAAAAAGDVRGLWGRGDEETRRRGVRGRK